MQTYASDNWRISTGVGRLRITHTVQPVFAADVFHQHKPPRLSARPCRLPNGQIVANLIWAGSPASYDQFQQLLQELAAVLDDYNSHTVSHRQEPTR